MPSFALLNQNTTVSSTYLNQLQKMSSNIPNILAIFQMTEQVNLK